MMNSLRRLLLPVIALLLTLPLGAGEAAQAPPRETQAEAAEPAGEEPAQPEPSGEPPPRPADTEPVEQVSADNNLTFPVDI